MSKRPDVYLDIAQTALRSVTRVLGERTLRDSLGDELCRAAIERQLEIAGDALGRLRRDAPDVFAKVPNGDLVVAFRNVLAHGYATLDHARVYEAAVRHAPPLATTLGALLSELSPRQN